MRHSQQFFLRIDIIQIPDSHFVTLRVWQAKQIVKYSLSQDQERDLLAQLLGREESTQ